jgi:pyranose oxidase
MEFAVAQFADGSQTEVDSVDLLVVGSGPAGSTIARQVHEKAPDLRILMVEAGPQLTSVAGASVLNLPLPQRQEAQRKAQGPDPDLPTSGTGIVNGAIAGRPGTFLLRHLPADVDRQKDMPAAAMSSNVGGMGAHWTCASPEPGGSEKIDFLDGAAWDDAFARAQYLLSVTTEGFPANPVSSHVRKVLGTIFDSEASAEASGRRPVQPMPLACTPREDAIPTWSGAAAVLGPLATADHDDHFTLASETLCRRLIHRDGHIQAAELEHRPTGRRWTVDVRAAAVAGDALRTPQLLWASGIRPPALGRYLNDQPQVVAAVDLDITSVDAAGIDASSEASGRDASVDIRDHFTGVAWIPFDDETHPYHGQVLQLDTSPILVGEEMTASDGPVVMLSWFLPKDVRAEDRVEFSVDEEDAFGLPAMTIRHTLTEVDERRIADAIDTVTRVGDALGKFVPRSHPRVLPSGSSMHYQGTVRMGPGDDGTSVCDPSSRVWGTDNLYVAGNGVIPTATACNPTATGVALAVIASARIAEQLTASATTAVGPVSIA